MEISKNLKIPPDKAKMLYEEFEKYKESKLIKQIKEHINIILDLYDKLSEDKSREKIKKIIKEELLDG